MNRYIGTGRGHRLTNANAVMRPQREPRGPHATSTTSVKAPRNGARRGYLGHETWLKQSGVCTALWRATRQAQRPEPAKTLETVVVATISIVDRKGKVIRTVEFHGTGVALTRQLKRLRKQQNGHAVVCQVLSKAKEMVRVRISDAPRRRGKGYVAVNGAATSVAEDARDRREHRKAVWNNRKEQRLAEQAASHNGRRGESLGAILAAAGIGA